MRKHVIAAAAMVAAVGNTFATVVGIDFGGTHATRGPTANMMPGVVGKDSDVVWNPVNNQNLYSNLLDEDGNMTGASFQITGDTPLNFGSTAAAAAGTGFFETFANISGSGTPGPAYTNSFTLAGLASDTVDLYFYATWEWIDAGTEFRVSGDGGTTWSEWKLSEGVPSLDTAPFAEGSSYVVFSDVTTPADGTILGEWQTSTNGASLANRGVFSAIQIVGEFDGAPPPEFTTNEFAMASATVGLAYDDTIADMATGSAITYSKSEGPAWLTVATNGVLSGTPAETDTGLNTFTVMVTDDQARTATATMTIQVDERYYRYVDTFDGDGIEINEGEGGGLVLAQPDGTHYLSITDESTALTFSKGPSSNVGAQRSGVRTTQMFSIQNGFQLDVTYNISGVPGELSESAGFGLVDRTTTLDGVFYAAKAHNSLGMSLTERNGNQGLTHTTYTEGEDAGVLTVLNSNQVVTAGDNKTFSLTVDADGNYSYSIDGQTPSTGTTTFDLTKSYYFAIFSQRGTTGFSVESVSFLPILEVSQIGDITMEKDGASASFTWYGDLGASYEFQTRDDLAIGGVEAWNTITNVNGYNADITVTDDLGEKTGFYRVKLAE